jgi:hypothetical protein
MEGAALSVIPMILYTSSLGSHIYGICIAFINPHSLLIHFQLDFVASMSARLMVVPWERKINKPNSHGMGQIVTTLPYLPTW